MSELLRVIDQIYHCSNIAERAQLVTQDTINWVATQCGIGITDEDIMTLMSMMTTEEVLRNIQHPPQLIDSNTFPHFDALKKERDNIQRLTLLPKRPDNLYHEYQLVDKNPFITTVDAYVGSAGIVVTKELYPSNLPKDVGQQVIWVQENVPKELIARCLAQLLAISDMSTTQCILYQRSKYTDIPYAKPSITKLPHIHCITEKPLALQLLRPAQILSDSFAFKHLTF